MVERAVQKARDIYNIAQWSDGYFDVSEKGTVLAYPDGIQNSSSSIDLLELTKVMREEGLVLPILVRFTGILRHRFASLRQAFANAMQENNYQGGFMSVYPIKVNQERAVVEEILENGEVQVGLECGSKPELMAVLAMSKMGCIVCNGYKDREYIRLALIGQRLGHRVYIVLEKLSELNIVLEESAKMGLQPLLGIRMRLASQGSGKWQESAGEKSKFGFSATQVLIAIEHLRAANQLHSLQLIHFFLGSQVANINDIHRAMRECARFYAELHALGVQINTVDVGGGLGVDYDGTHSRSFCSINYTTQEYANTIVYALNEICAEKNLPPPQIITESGRAMVAHHAVLITNVIDVEYISQEADLLTPAQKEEVPVIHNLWNGYSTLSERSALETYHDACYWMTEVQSMYVHGVLNLRQRARAEQIYYAICIKVRELLQPGVRLHRQVLDELNGKLADKYFCNFSLFQSLPDAWAIDQIFPIMPISGLDQKLSRRGILQDVTCDSDGRIKSYVDGYGVESTLPLPPYSPGEPYVLGMFLVGAYQEILGDLHNLFGDTDSVLVEQLPEGKFRLVKPSNGDSVESVLRYVHFEPNDLLQAYHKQLDAANLAEAESKEYLDTLVAGLNGYTYFED